ncbi:hypothetical protein CEXT_112271 [Caerostris extrusa]|uniref:Uncharacterized protein n=1 Tax=Caerostris extrusa TaxID=172846 RepID=A0AAV4NGM8_CAEEX|nr:hypothetical protein CEXT_112271 [Caerostris extrusa]
MPRHVYLLGTEKKREDSKESTGQTADEYAVSQYKANKVATENLQDKSMQVVGEIDVYVDADYEDDEMF